MFPECHLVRVLFASPLAPPAWPKGRATLIWRDSRTSPTRMHGSGIFYHFCNIMNQISCLQSPWGMKYVSFHVEYQESAW